MKDQFICRRLCSKSVILEARGNKPVSPCERMCFELTRTNDFAGEVCPFEKYCPRGCPCDFYNCAKIVNEQTLVPLWDLKNSTVGQGKFFSG